MLDHGYSPGSAEFHGMLNNVRGLAPKKIKEDCDCVIMRQNNIGFPLYRGTQK